MNFNLEHISNTYTFGSHHVHYMVYLTVHHQGVHGLFRAASAVCLSTSSLLHSSQTTALKDFILYSIFTYVVCLLYTRKTSIKIKRLKIKPRSFLAFFSLGPGKVDLFFTALSLPPERLGDVRRCAIFRTPSSSFWEAS